MVFLDLKVNARSEILDSVSEVKGSASVAIPFGMTLCVCVYQAVFNYRFGVGYANGSCSYAV
jgi:hypothetical protein